MANYTGSFASNLEATTDPGVTDDSAAGYAVGSLWINVTLGKVWQCVDSAVGAAVWKDLSAPGVGGGQTDTVVGSAGITNVGTNVDADLAPTYGSAANTITVGNDARLSDARVPTAHALSHQDGGSDEVATATPAAAAIPKADGSGTLDAWISAASPTVAGIMETAIVSEVNTGADDARAVSPLSLAGSTLALNVTTNNAKVTNATHTGDVTGATALTIAANAVTLAKMAQLATARFLGRVTAGVGDPEAITGTQATTLLDQFTALLKGLVPASGGGTANFLRADGTFAVPPGGGAATVDTANTNWVAKDGNDGTALVDRQDLPWLTIAPALAAAGVGDIVRVRSGTYTPAAGLTVPAGVALIGDDFLTTIIDGSALAAHVITLLGTATDSSYLQNFRIDAPTAAGFAGLTHSAFTASIYDLDLRGNGVAGLGDGVYKTGSGKIVGSNIRCDLGGMGAHCRVDGGVLALDDCHIPQSAGAIAQGILVSGTGRFQGQGSNAGNTNITANLKVEGTGIALIYSPNWSNAAIGAHIAADGVTVTVIGGKIDPTFASILVDGALTGVGTKITVSGTTVQPLFSFPAAAIAEMDLNATFHQEQTSTRDSESRVVGAEFVTGFPELGSGLAVGEGSPYSDGQVVLSSDSTAGPASDGAGFVDESAAAGSRSASTFTFQGLTGGATGFSILWCTSRIDAVGVALKHWGLEIDQDLVGAVLGAGSFIFEIQTAANTWVEIDVMAINVASQYRYANDVFLRPSSEETIRPGIDGSTTWAETTISGTLGHWMRVRIAATITTAPTFQRWRLIPSHVATNAQGQLTARGLAMWRSTLFGVGNVWGEVGGGGAADANISVGSGGSPTGWTQKIKKGKLNSAGDSVSFQFALPAGLCTAFPLFFTLSYSLDGGANPGVGGDVILSVLVLGAGGVLIADSGGAVAPVARAATAAEAYGSKAASFDTVVTDTGAVLDRPLTMTFGPFSIADYYEGDSAVLRLELDTLDDESSDLIIWTLEAVGVAFTTGGIL